MSFINNLNWRYATKQFNGTIVGDVQLDTILEAIRLTPSSTGMQPYHVVVASGVMKNKLIESSGQVAKIGASHLLVFCSRTDYPSRAEQQIANTAHAQGVSVESLSGLKKMVWMSFESKTPEKLIAWAERQVYIALGFALAACAELEIDTCPMEGFNPDAFHEILELPEYIRPVVILAVGHRDPNDSAQPSKRAKVRFPKDDLFSFK